MPTEIIKHERISDYFHVVEGDPRTHRDQIGDSLVQWYEDGDVIVFDQPWLDCDVAFLQSLPVLKSDNHTVKKAKPRSLLQPLVKETYHEHVLRFLFPDSIEAARHYQNQVNSVSAQLNAFIDYAFPGYEITDRDQYSWRFTLTENEGLHYDHYGDTSTEERATIRCFINLDDQPRLWGTSYKIQDAIALYRESRQLTDHANLHPNLFNKFVSQKGGMPLEKFPQHRVAFAPLSMWLVNSQIVGHNIIHGRRLLAYTFSVKPESLRDPNKNFVEVVRRALS